MPDGRSGGVAPGQRSRRGYLDWLRGLAVLIMIEAHLLDSWTAAPYRESREFTWAIILGGFGAPLFLFLAGVAVALAAGSRSRRLGDARAAARTIVRRGLQIFALAFLFRLQAVVLSWGAWATLLNVDILNIMGLSIAAAASIWRVAAVERRRGIALAIATLAVTLLTPIVRGAPALAVLPDPVEGYLRPIPGLTNFVLFPWAGFVFAGAGAGMAIDAARTTADERRVNLILGFGGAALASVAYGASYLPTPYRYTYFWTTSPAFLLMRIGILSAAVALAYAWERRTRQPRWSPLQQLGRTSLFIYWIHVEMVYGLMSLPLHKALTFRSALLALGAFAVLMLACSVAKDRVVAWWRSRPAGRPALSAVNH